MQGTVLLLVEDDPDDAVLLLRLLEDSGATPIRLAVSLSEAVTQLRSRHYDAVLLDLRLPDGIGIQCVDAIRSAAGDVPIVVLTGMEDEELATRCLQAGAQDYLYKNKVERSSLKRAILYARARMAERTQRERADELREQLATIVDVSQDGILSMTVDGTIVSWNNGATHVLGPTASEVVGKPLQQIVNGTGEAWQNLWQLIEQGQEVRSEAPVDAVWKRQDGACVNVSVMVSPIQSASGTPTGAAVVFRDVTKQRRQDMQLREANAHLHQREKEMQALTVRLNETQEAERTRLARQVHDELGQMLTGIKMDLRWLSKHLDGKTPQTRLVDRISEAETLVDQTVSSMQDIAITLRPSVLDALGLPAAIRDETRRFEKRSDLDIELSVDSEVKPDPKAATALFRILQELLSNVARHAKARHVQVGLHASPQHWTLSVTDDGIGIPDDLETRPALGLLGMKERAEALNGAMFLGRDSSGGTVARVQVPR